MLIVNCVNISKLWWFPCVSNLPPTAFHITQAVGNVEHLTLFIEFTFIVYTFFKVLILSYSSKQKACIDVLVEKIIRYLYF